MKYKTQLVYWLLSASRVVVQNDGIWLLITLNRLSKQNTITASRYFAFADADAEMNITNKEV